MKKLSFESITSFVGDVLPIRLTSDKEDLSSCDIKWECTGDAAVLRTFSGDGEYSFADGALIVLVKEGVACVSAMLDGVRYSAEVVAKAMDVAEVEGEFKYFLGDMHDHTSQNHDQREFATQNYGKIEDYLSAVFDEGLLDFCVISDHASVTNDYLFFHGFELSRGACNEKPIIFAGAESEVEYCEEDRLGVLKRLSGEIVTINSAGYAYALSWEDFEKELHTSPKAVAIFAHPHVVGYSTNGIWDFNFKKINTPTLLRVIRGIEMGNGEDRKENLLHEYAISAALDAGFRVSTTCASDSHGPDWSFNSMPAKTVIMAREHSREAFLDALLNNRFYGTESGNVKIRYTVNGALAPTDLSPTDTYRFHVDLSCFKNDETTRPISIKVISDYGNTLLEFDTGGSDSLDFTVKSDTARYFYLRLIDKEGRRTWSVPVWCERAYDTHREPKIKPLDATELRAFYNGCETPKVINGNPYDSLLTEGSYAEITMELGKERRICAVGYYPHVVLRDEKKGPNWTTADESAGLVSHYRIMTSLDGESYTERKSGTCQALGSEEIIEFEPCEARYVRFVALGTVGSSSGIALSSSSVRSRMMP